MDKSKDDLARLAEEAQAHDDEGGARRAIRDRLRDRKTSKELKQLLRATEHELEEERRARELLLALSEPAAPYKVKKHRGKGGKNAAVTVSLLSDVHCEEIVSLDEVNGRNEHTLEMCDVKLERYASGVVKLVEKEQSFHDIRTHVQWIGGDLFTGHIHDEMVETTSLSPLESVLWIHPRIKSLLRHLAENLQVDEILVPWSFGNHGRDGKKPRISKHAQHNFEYLLAHTLKKEIENEPWGKKIRFIVEPGYLTYVDLGGYVVAFHHGDGLRYGGGVGGLTIPLNKAVHAWNEHTYADLYVNGHYHQVLDAGRFVCNGSMIGMNQFAIRIKAAPEPAQQVMFTIDLDRRQKVSFNLIHVLPTSELERLGWV